jgi:hypothetical protein
MAGRLGRPADDKERPMTKAAMARIAAQPPFAKWLV